MALAGAAADAEPLRTWFFVAVCCALVFLVDALLPILLLARTGRWLRMALLSVTALVAGGVAVVVAQQTYATYDLYRQGPCPPYFVSCPPGSGEAWQHAVAQLIQRAAMQGVVLLVLAALVSVVIALVVLHTRRSARAPGTGRVSS